MENIEPILDYFIKKLENKDKEIRLLNNKIEDLESEIIEITNKPVKKGKSTLGELRKLLYAPEDVYLVSPDEEEPFLEEHEIKLIENVDREFKSLVINKLKQLDESSK